jgi:hypothetical protein
VASIGTTDVQRIGRLLDVSARATGAIVSYVFVTVILFTSSVRLGLVLVVGAPLFALLVLPVIPLARPPVSEATLPIMVTRSTASSPTVPKAQSIPSFRARVAVPRPRSAAATH